MIIDDLLPENNIIIHDEELYESGMNILLEVYQECHEMVGGADATENRSKVSNMLGKVFSSSTRASLTRTIRGAIRTTTGLTADIATMGVGGDVVVNSVFAISSSMSFINSIEAILKVFSEVKSLFNKLIRVNYGHTIPIFSKIVVDDGFDKFKETFQNIILEHISEYGLDSLSKMHNAILKIITKVTTTVSDWFGCLFPDTVGLASEICKTLLDYVTNHSYDLIYKVVSFLSDTMQKMITNTHALKKLIHTSVKYLRDLIKGMKPQQISELIQSLGVKISDLTSNSILKSTIGIGTHVASKIVNVGMKAYNVSTSLSKLSFIPRAQDIFVYIIDKLVIPNINTGVDMFYQLFPLYLMFSLFISNYAQVKDRLIESDPDSGKIISIPD